MENKTETIEICPKNMYVHICIAQAICITVIIISVLVVKFFFKNPYTQLQNWCKENVLEQIKITAFLQEENESEN